MGVGRENYVSQEFCVFIEAYQCLLCGIDSGDVSS